MGGACSPHEGGDKSAQNVGCKSEGKRPLVRHRHAWEDNIKI